MFFVDLLGKYGISVTFLVTNLLVSANISEDLVVVTDLGPIRGLRADDGNYSMFLGIPYAKVNESNVFGDSIPHEPFDRVFEAYDDTAMCPQFDAFSSTALGSLDCLQMNVYVPDSSQNLLPVMVFIHGGGFASGSFRRSEYGPRYIIRHNVILVVINYRLGPYGFMCLDTPENPGNAGLKDQMIALRWIHSNIKSFGGDPNQVTLFGNSAGSISIGLHLISETEKLYSNIIMQSGPSFSPGVLTNTVKTAAIDLAGILNYETDDVNEAISFLSSTDVQSVINTSVLSGIIFTPCVEKEFPGVLRFLAENPIHSQHSKAPGVAVILGYTSDELLSFFPGNEGPSNWLIWDQSFNTTLQSGFDFDDIQMSELSDLVRRFYVGDGEINNDVRQEIMDFLNDFNFIYPTIRQIEPFLKAGVEKVHQYVFSYDGNMNIYKIRNNITVPGASHVDETGYLFAVDYFTEEPSEEDQLIIDRITTMWTNFAKFRDPTPETNSLFPVKWEPITTGSPYHYININSEMTTDMRYATQRMSFWELFYKTFKQYEKGYIFNDSEDEISVTVPDSSHIVYLHPVIIIFISVVFFFMFS